MKNKMTRCKSCGAEIQKNAKTCPHCGAKNKVIHPIRGAIGGMIALILCIIILPPIINASSADAKPPSVPTSVNTTDLPAETDAQVVFDRGGIKITYTGMKLVEYIPGQEDGYMLTVGLKIENTSENDITVLPEDSSVNDVMKLAVSGMPLTALSGKTAIAGISFTNLKDAGIESVNDIDKVNSVEFKLSVEDNNNSEELFKSDTITLKP